MKSDQNKEDRLLWIHTATCKFSVNSFYKVLNTQKVKYFP